MSEPRAAPPSSGALPHALQEIADHALERIHERLAGADPAVRAQVASVDAATVLSVGSVLARSAFVVEHALHSPLEDVLTLLTGAFGRAPSAEEMRADLQATLEGADDDAEMKLALRRWRGRVQCGVVWRDLLGINDLDATTAQLSDMADIAINAALAWCTAKETVLRGVPNGGRSGQLQQLVVLAMGKLGARELNLSSDIDLIFTYPEAGETAGGTARAVTHHAFFLRVAQRLIAALDEHTGEGFVFRVDMRLRPFGESGALVTSFDAFEDYYQEQGRSWERYAMIKARPVTGDPALGEALLHRLRPFVYRRYLDFGAVESLREMKELIARERRAPEFADDVKLGPGGIREVEFVAQVFQLIFGGREPALRERRLRTVLPALVAGGWLSAAAARELEDAYVFLRHVEHRIQALRDEQTQKLPVREDERLCVAVGMGFADWPGFKLALDAHRRRVHAEFERVVAREQGDAAIDGLWPALGLEAAARLAELGFGAASVLPALTQRQQARARLQNQDEARRRLDVFVPRLLDEASRTSAPERALLAGLRIAEAVLRRSAYLALLNENPGALAQLVRLCAASDAIAARLAERPALLDELLDSRSLLTLPDRQQIDGWLHAHLARVPADDLEQQMDALRSFKEGHALRVAVCEVMGLLPLMKVSDSLTWCAEAVLDAALELAWRLTVAQYGRPAGGHEFLIVGYGKLGGLELGPGSDLDLLFLHDAPMDGMTEAATGQAASAGGNARSVPTPTFYARLSQRLLHILTTQTQRGALYEIDTRLRPSGRAGMMVTAIAGFESYQRDEAWTYEHQALVRARPVSGARLLGEKFEDVRRRILARPRDAVALREEVLAMRERMQASAGQLGQETSAELKRGRGGIVDIEFMVQYLVLAHAAQHPSLMRWTDNVRILESAARAGVIAEDRANGLTDAYLALRAAAHAHALGARVPPADELETWREYVRESWQAVFGVPMLARPSG